MVVCPPLFTVVQDPSDPVSPFRVREDAVDVALRGVTVADQEHLPLVEALLPDLPQDLPDRIALRSHEDDAEAVEQQHQAPGEVVNIRVLGSQVKDQGHTEQPDGAGLDRLFQLRPSASDPLSGIQAEQSEKHEPAGKNEKQGTQIDRKRQDAVIGSLPEQDEPRQQVCCSDDKCVQKGVKPVQLSLKVLAHAEYIPSSLCQFKPL